MRKKFFFFYAMMSIWTQYRRYKLENKRNYTDSRTGKRKFPDWTVNALTNKCVGVFHARRLNRINFNWLKVRLSRLFKSCFLAKIGLLRLVRYDWDDFTKRVNFGVEIARWVGVNLWELVKNWQARTGVGYSTSK